MTIWLGRWIALATALLIWTAVATAIPSQALMASPLQVLLALTDFVQSGTLWRDLSASLSRVVAGYALGATIGISVGMLTGRSSVFDAAVASLLQVLRPVPAIAIVPFVILMSGLSYSSQVFLVAWGTFFPIWINMHLGVRLVDRRMAWIAQSLGASRLEVWRLVLLPATFDHIIPVLRSAVGTAYICLVACELAGARDGVAYRLAVAQQVFRTDQILALLLVLGLLGWGSDQLIGRLVAVVMPWYGRSGQDTRV